MKHVASTLIGQTGQTGSRANLNVVGSNAGQAGAAASQADTAKLKAYLVRHSPKEVDAALVLRASQLGVELKVQFDYRFPKDAVGNPLPLVTIVKGVQILGTEADCTEAHSKLSGLLAAPEMRDVEAWLAELSVIVARRAEDEFSEGLRLEAYASRMRRYPVDVARDAVLGRTWKFWPTWAELEKHCEELVAPRRAMLAALERRATSDLPHYAPAPERRERVTAERAAEIMREVFGDRQAAE